MNNTDKTILQKFTKELSTLHYALTFGALLVTILLYFFTVKEGYFDFSNTDDYFLYLCPLLAIGGVFGGMYMYRNKIAKIDLTNDLEDKLAAYRVATVQKFSLTEGPALISALAMMQTQNLLYLVIALALVVYLFSMKISEDKIIEELGID